MERLVVELMEDTNIISTVRRYLEVKRTIRNVVLDKGFTISQALDVEESFPRMLMSMYELSGNKKNDNEQMLISFVQQQHMKASLGVLLGVGLSEEAVEHIFKYF